MGPFYNWVDFIAVRETKFNTQNQMPIKFSSAHCKRYSSQAVPCCCVRVNPIAFEALIPDGFYKLLRQSGLLKEVHS